MNGVVTPGRLTAVLGDDPGGRSTFVRLVVAATSEPVVVVEPVPGLPRRRRRPILRACADLARAGRAVVLVTDDATDALEAGAHRAVVLSGPAPLAVGPPEQVLPTVCRELGLGNRA
ncbi:MAG TPA: hypothetical protein VM618_12100 [Acidimicrobiia bacterium]|nr:hypothetical protein [Acidimicrobiia bacterium]